MGDYNVGDYNQLLRLFLSLRRVRRAGPRTSRYEPPQPQRDAHFVGCLRVAPAEPREHLPIRIRTCHRVHRPAVIPAPHRSPPPTTHRAARLPVPPSARQPPPPCHRRSRLLCGQSSCGALSAPPPATAATSASASASHSSAAISASPSTTRRQASPSRRTAGSGQPAEHSAASKAGHSASVAARECSSAHTSAALSPPPPPSPPSPPSPSPLSPPSPPPSRRCRASAASASRRKQSRWP